MINVLTVFGTRPEAIKLASIIHQLSLHDDINSQVCVTGQHQQMLDSVLALFEIAPNYNLQVMTTNQDLSDLTAKILTGLSRVLREFTPDLIIVHGDTTTTLAASLAAFYHKIPVAHVEAGLRTGDNFSPWPEEVNRRVTGVLASIHFAPTELARSNLLREGVAPHRVHITGNTVIDALFNVIHKIETNAQLSTQLQQDFSFIQRQRKLILVTGHRRENFGVGLEQICAAIRQIAENFPDIDIVFPVHLNPNIQQTVYPLLGKISNVFLTQPLDYASFVYLMQNAYLILTDSGGIQEEAPSLGKPVLLMRETTERPEALSAGTVQLVGTDVKTIVGSVERLLKNTVEYSKMSHAQNPYGDGHAASRIVQLIRQMHFNSNELETIHNKQQMTSVIMG